MTLLDISLYQYFVSIFLLIVAVGLSIRTYVALVLKASRKKDKFHLLRKWFRQNHETIIAIGAIAIIVLSARFFITGDIARIFISSLVLLFSIGYLILAVLNRKIWNQEYRKKL